MLEALRLFPDTKEEDWRKEGEALIHQDVDLTNFKGRMVHGIFRSGTFYDGEFFGGVYHAGTYHGGHFYGGIWKRSPIFVQGPRDYVCESDDGCICAGCQRGTMDWWCDRRLDMIGAQNHYTPAEIEQYKTLFAFVKSEMKRMHDGPN